MSNLASRLQKARKEAGFSSVKEAAEGVGVTYHTYAQHENGTRGFKVNRAEVYASAFKVDLQWLLTGKTTPYKVPADEEGERHNEVYINQLDVRFGMGGEAIYGASVKPEPMSFSKAWIRQLTASPADQLFWASGLGDSMYPTMADGDIVLVDCSQKELRMRDQIWALNHCGQGMIKRLRATSKGYRIISDNPSVPSDTATAESMEIVGRVVAIIRRV